MDNIILLLVCFFSGIALRRSSRMPSNLPSAFNSFIIHISLPALTLLYIHELKFSLDLLLVISMPWMLFGIALLTFICLGRYLKLSKETCGALILTAGLGNTSFLGLPMIEAFWGKSGIAYGILVDQLGSFLVLSILGISTAAFYAGGKASWSTIIKRIVFFPPFIALLCALSLTTTEYPEWLIILLKRLGDTLVPLALFSVGFQFNPGHIGKFKNLLAIGLGFKLIVAPSILYGIYTLILRSSGLPTQVTLFEAAMPPMIIAGVVASEHNLNPKLANLMVSLGLAISFISLPIWYLVLRTI